MIYEIRTYSLRPRTTAEVEKRFQEAYEARKKHSPLAGFFHTDIGPLNEVVMIWPYADLDERARIREAANGEPGWPPSLGEFVTNQKVEVVVPFDFVPEWTPGADGPFYELRQYSFKPGTLGPIKTNWAAALPDRLKFSRPALIGSVELGPTVNSFIHLWPYKTLADRDRARSEASAARVWPPAGGADFYLTQASKLLLPSSFSPAQ